MTVYSDSDFGKIAEAIGVKVAAVKKHAPRFEEAAFWYRRTVQNPLPKTPSALRNRADKIAKAARRLLKHLGVDDPRQAADGPGEPWILELLTYAEGASGNSVVSATERIGCLAEIISGICAAREIEGYAVGASSEVQALADAIGIKGHSGDKALEMWLGWMMSIYQAITGFRPKMNVGGSGQPDEGVASGKFIDRMSLLVAVCQ